MVAAEVAVCRACAGIADLSGAPVWELRGPADAVADVLLAATGTCLAPGEAAPAAGAWWCAVTGSRVLVLDAVAAPSRSRRGVSAMDLTGDYRVVGLLGPCAEAVLRASDGFEGLPAVMDTGAFTLLTGRRPAMVLREAPERFEVLVPRTRGAALWDELMAAGRARGAACVGHDAVNLLRAREAVPAAADSTPLSLPSGRKSAHCLAARASASLRWDESEDSSRFTGLCSTRSSLTCPRRAFIVSAPVAAT